MSSFSRDDYRHLFELGALLYEENTSKAFVREVAVRIMAMSESVIGQQAGWPCVDKRYQRFNTYEASGKNDPTNRRR